MALVLNGSGSITGLSAGGLPDGSVTADDIASTLDLSGKTVTLPAGTGGKVLQVVNFTYQTEVFTTVANTPVDTGLSASITPSSASNKILVFVSQSVSPTSSGSNGFSYVYLLRGATDIYVDQRFVGVTQYNHAVWSATYLDSPSTTSSVTYKTQIATNNSSYVIQAQHADLRPSSITLMEIAA